MAATPTPPPPATALQLEHPERAPPLAALATAALGGIALDLAPQPDKDAPVLLRLPGGDEVAGLPSVLRYLARAAPPGAGLYGAAAGAPLDAVRVDEWIDFAAARLAPGAGLEPACAAADAALATRTYCVGHAPSAADAAAWGALAAAPQWGRALSRSPALPHLRRWFEHVGRAPPLAALAAEHAAAYAPRGRPAPAAGAAGGAAGGGAPARRAADAGGSFDVGLVDARRGAVVTRFPPEPSGYLHIGHAKAALLNAHFAAAYEGRLIVRFDDTNPSKEKDEFVDNILADLARLGVAYDRLTYTSDYFPQLAEVCARLLAAGHCYADDTPVERMRDERGRGVPSARRGAPPEASLAAWREMQAGTDEGRRWCIRVKLDMTAGNKALRDPVAYRCNPAHHWRTGHAYKAYPTYDFACPFVDATEGVTHALRTSEYRDREAQFHAILALQRTVWPNLPVVHIWDYARLSMIHTALSKRKLAWFVDRGVVDGWDDPRMPTVQGMLRRGLQVPALREFILSQGASKNVTYQEWDKIWALNKKEIDPVCPRHTAVEAAGAVRVTIEGAPHPPEAVDAPRHAKHAGAGTRRVLRGREALIDGADAEALADGEEVTLMGWGNAVVAPGGVERDAATGNVAAVRMRLHLEGDFKKTRLKLTWLCALDAAGERRAGLLPPLELHHFGYLLDKRKLEDDDDFEAHVTAQSRWVTAAHGDPAMRALLKKGDVLQLERKGYFIVDAAADPGDPTRPMVLFNIPDGRAKSVAGGAPAAGGPRE